MNKFQHKGYEILELHKGGSALAGFFYRVIRNSDGQKMGDFDTYKAAQDRADNDAANPEPIF